MAIAPGKWKQFYDDQVHFCEVRDLDGLADHYTEDAALIAFDYQVFGRQNIREHFVRYLDRLGSLKLKSTDKYIETDDSLYFEATITVAAGEALVYDVFLMRDGKAYRHFTGLRGFIPN